MGYHAVNVLLHAGVCLLYHQLVTEFTTFSGGGGDFVAFASGLLFAVHPVHTEAVTGVVGRAELISSAFVIVCILAYKRGRQLAAVPLLVTAAMLSKEQGITVLGVCFVIELVMVQNVVENFWAGQKLLKVRTYLETLI